MFKLQEGEITFYKKTNTVQSRRKNSPRLGGRSRMLRGLMLRMKIFFYFFNVFKIFVKFVHNDSVVTYLIFEFLIPACYTYTHVYIHVHSAHCVWKCTVIFSGILNTGPHSCIWGVRQIQVWGPLAGGGLSGASGGLHSSLSPALKPSQCHDLSSIKCFIINFIYRKQFELSLISCFSFLFIHLWAYSCVYSFYVFCIGYVSTARGE